MTINDIKKAISDIKYVSDIGDNKRKERCKNISLALLSNYIDLQEEDRKSGKKFVHKGILRDFILGRTNQLKKVSDKVGDSRAHGDACGGHGLHLEMEGRGSSGLIYFNDKNMKKCLDFINLIKSNDNEVTLV